MTMLRLAALAALSLGLAAVGCAASSDEAASTDGQDLSSTGHGSDEWFYSGAIPALENPATYSWATDSLVTRLVCDYLTRTGELRSNPSATLASPKLRRKLPRFLTAEVASEKWM